MYRGFLKVALIALVFMIGFGLIATVVLRWRESANRLRCQEHLRRVGWFAMWQYTDRELAFPKGPDAPDRTLFLPDKIQPEADRTFPPGTIPHATLPPEQRLSWGVILLPYLAQEDVLAKFDQKQGWEAEANQAGVRTLVPMFVCPSQYERAGPGEPVVTHYIGMAGVGRDAPTLPQADPRAGFLRYGDATKVGAIKRGLSNTIAVLETSVDLGPWAAGGPATVRGLDSARMPYLGFARPFGGHPRGAHAAFADGSVRFLDESLSPRVLEMLATLAVREPFAIEN